MAEGMKWSDHGRLVVTSTICVQLIVWKKILVLRKMIGFIRWARSTSRTFGWDNRNYLAISRDFSHGYLPTAAAMAFSLSVVCIVRGRPAFTSVPESRRRLCNSRSKLGLEYVDQNHVLLIPVHQCQPDYCKHWDWRKFCSIYRVCRPQLCPALHCVLCTPNNVLYRRDSYTTGCVISLWWLNVSR
jgi:hypothetical protein